MFSIGLDLGQRRDHSAVVVVERLEVRRAYQAPRFGGVAVRHVERVRLGTPYPDVVARVREIARHGELVGKCGLVVDGTGVGAPVVEMLRRAGLGCEVMAVTITGGERAHSVGQAGGPAWNVPKQDLMAGVQVLLERGELKIAKGMREAGTLVRELLDVRARDGKRAGRVKYGAEGEGEHDDLVMALALGCWGAGKKMNGFGVRRLTGI